MALTSPRTTTFIHAALWPEMHVTDDLSAAVHEGRRVDGWIDRTVGAEHTLDYTKGRPESFIASAASTPAASGISPSCRHRRPHTSRRFGRRAPGRCPHWHTPSLAGV